jgi:hypothetical protein
MNVWKIGAALVTLVTAMLANDGAAAADNRTAYVDYRMLNSATNAAPSLTTKFNTGDLRAGIGLGHGFKFFFRATDQFTIQTPNGAYLTCSGDPHWHWTEFAGGAETEYGDFRRTHEVVVLAPGLVMFVKAVDGNGEANAFGYAEEVTILSGDECFEIKNIHYAGGNAHGQKSFDGWYRWDSLVKSGFNVDDPLAWNGTHVVDRAGKFPKPRYEWARQAKATSSKLFPQFNGSPEFLDLGESSELTSRSKCSPSVAKAISQYRRAVNGSASEIATIRVAAQIDLASTRLMLDEQIASMKTKLDESHTVLVANSSN